MESRDTPTSRELANYHLWQMLRISLAREYDFALLNNFLLNRRFQAIIYDLLQEYERTNIEEQIELYTNAFFANIRNEFHRQRTSSFLTVSPINEAITVNESICTAFINEVNRGLNMENQEGLTYRMLDILFSESPQINLTRLIGLSVMDCIDKIEQGLYPENFINTMTSELIIFTYTLVGTT